MRSRLLLGVSLLVAFLLVGGLFYPAVFGDPYEPRSEFSSYYIAHESTADFAAEVEEGFNGEYGDDPTPLEDFDAEEQRLFETIYEKQPEEVYNSPAEDEYVDLRSERETYTITACEDWALTCDAYETIPTFSTDESHRTSSKAHVELTFVEYESEAYVVAEHHQQRPLFHNAVEVLLRLGLFGPLALAIGGAAVAAREAHPKTVLALTGYGIGIGGLGIATPYLYMFNNIYLLTYMAELVLVTWSVISVTVLYLWWSEPPTAESESNASETDSDSA